MSAIKKSDAASPPLNPANVSKTPIYSKKASFNFQVPVIAPVEFSKKITQVISLLDDEDSIVIEQEALKKYDVKPTKVSRVELLLRKPCGNFNFFIIGIFLLYFLSNIEFYL